MKGSQSPQPRNKREFYKGVNNVTLTPFIQGVILAAASTPFLHPGLPFCSALFSLCIQKTFQPKKRCGRCLLGGGPLLGGIR